MGEPNRIELPGFGVNYKIRRVASSPVIMIVADHTGSEHA